MNPQYRHVIHGPPHHSMALLGSIAITNVYFILILVFHIFIYPYCRVWIGHSFISLVFLRIPVQFPTLSTLILIQVVNPVASIRIKIRATPSKQKSILHKNEIKRFTREQLLYFIEWKVEEDRTRTSYLFKWNQAWSWLVQIVENFEITKMPSLIKTAYP